MRVTADEFRALVAPPAPMPPEQVSAILRDPDSPLYPSLIGVFCDGCGTTVERDYMVSTEQTKAERLEVARAALRAEGWACDEHGDHCPACKPVPAPAPARPRAKSTGPRPRRGDGGNCLRCGKALTYSAADSLGPICRRIIAAEQNGDAQ